MLGLFLHLRRTQAWPVELLCASELLAVASATRELAALATEPGVHTFDASGRTIDVALIRALQELRARRPELILHFVLMPPQLAGVMDGRRSIFSATNADLQLYNRRGRWMLYTACALARRVDFLEPSVRDKVASYMPWAAARFRVTPGSFVDTSLFHPAPAHERERSVVFLGRFLHEKGAYRLAERLIETNRLLEERGIHGVKYRFLGRDNDQPPLTPRLLAMRDKLDIEVGFDPDPQNALSRAAVFLSLQFRTNYPSKSLLEAMAGGAIPVVTDTGNTREIVNDTFGYFVPKAFEARHLADCIYNALTLSDQARDERVRAMYEHLARRFSLQAMADYYVSLYRDVDELSSYT